MKYLKYICYILLFGVNSLNASATNTDKQHQAEEYYASGHNDEALNIYLSLSKQGMNADLYYNLANCYYRMDSIPQSLLWYERAYMLNPGDPDIRYNLQYARTKTIDKIVPEEDIFFFRWYKSIINMFSADNWTIAGIVLFALCLTSLCIYFFVSDIRLRKTGFYGACILFIMILCANLFAWQQSESMKRHDRAIIFDSSISCKSSPNMAGKELFLLHEGTTVTIIDKSVTNWLQVRLPNGKEGWIPTSSVEVI